MRRRSSTELLGLAPRSRRALAARLLAALLGCALSAGAQAAESAPAGAGARAEALLEQGVELRRLGKDQEALTVLEEAVALQPRSARARVHLAAVHQSLGHWLEADALLRELLGEPEDPYVRRHLATLERAAEFAAQHLGTLIVDGAPEGAAVLVNGRPLGSLPLTAGARLPIGSQQLEVSRSGYYPVRRPIRIDPGAVLREAVELTPLPPRLSAEVAAAPRIERAAGSPRWLSWSLSGLAAGAAVTSAVALGVRNQHAARWNSAACLDGGRRRGEVCPDELDAGRDAERLAFVSGAGAVLFAAGAVLSWALDERGAPGPELASCRLGPLGGVCSGSF
ncbi:MAG TPA: PEGA domain-containing protein [Polyangiaceae bacterium]|nr:PEGA domain-containing protein [Polyangiaceae bacterium]